MIYEGLDLKIGTDVYEPKEDSFLLAKAVEEFAFGKTIDIGTGTGIQGIVAAKKGCEVTFSDISGDTLGCAMENAKRNGVSGKFIQSDLFQKISEKYNTIIFNPPYLHSKELSKLKKPVLPLDGGKGGREVIDGFLSGYGSHLLEEHIVLLVESSVDHYEGDVKRLNATVVGKVHRFFEDIVVLKFE